MGTQQCSAVSFSPKDRALSGELLGWLLFCATSIHLVFLVPNLTLIPGERAKVFSGTGCWLSLIMALAFTRNRGEKLRNVPLVISVALGCLMCLSGLFSLTPASSLARVYVMAGAGLGGFWCARLLLDTPERQRIFLWLCFVCLSGLVALSLFSTLEWQSIERLVDTHWHPVADRVILLSFAPLALLFTKSVRSIIMAVVLIGAGYVVLLSGAEHAGMESAALIPVVMFLVAVLLWELAKPSTTRLAAFLVVMFSMALVAGNHLHHHASGLAKTNMSIAYRAENIFFSWEIAKKHPLLGIGPWAPRDEMLRDYQTRYPFVDKESFVKWTAQLRTSESIFLTFMADFGLPFVVLYAAALTALLLILLRAVFHPPSHYVVHPLALLLPLVGALLHYQVYDGPFHPQVSWFFHILLGLIPTSVAAREKDRQNMRIIPLKILVVAVVILVGAFIGTLLPPRFPFACVPFLR